MPASFFKVLMTHDHSLFWQWATDFTKWLYLGVYKCAASWMQDVITNYFPSFLYWGHGQLTANLLPSYLPLITVIQPLKSPVQYYNLVKDFATLLLSYFVLESHLQPLMAYLLPSEREWQTLRNKGIFVQSTIYGTLVINFWS